MIRFCRKANSILVKYGIPPSVSLVVGAIFCMPLLLSVVQAHRPTPTMIVFGCCGIIGIFLGVASVCCRNWGVPVQEPDEGEREDVAVDIVFGGKKPTISDLHAMIEGTPTSELGFHHLSDLVIEQVDDYYGITIEGDVVVWFFPIVDGKEVYHDPGPFDAIRIAYVVRTGRKDVFANALRAATRTGYTLALHNGAQIDLKVDTVINEILRDA